MYKSEIQEEPDMRSKKKTKKLPAAAPAETALELLPMLLAKDKSGDQKLLRFVLSNVNAANLKRLAAVAVAGGVAVSLVGNWLHNRVYRAAVARELKKQLAPVNKKLDELEKQNEDLKKQLKG